MSLCLTEKILCLCSEECDGHEEEYIIEGKAGGIAAYREKLKKIVNPIKNSISEGCTLQELRIKRN